MPKKRFIDVKEVARAGAQDTSSRIMDPIVTDQQAVDLLAVDLDPLATLETKAAEAGIPQHAIKRLLERLKARYSDFNGELRRVTTGELVRLLEDRAWRALEYLDDFALADAKAVDLAKIAGIMLEKRQLLRGEPTTILSFEERKQLNELGPILLKQLTARGMMLEAHDPTEPTERPYERKLNAKPRPTVRERIVRKRNDDAIANGEAASGTLFAED